MAEDVRSPRFIDFFIKAFVEIQKKAPFKKSEVT